MKVICVKNMREYYYSHFGNKRIPLIIGKEYNVAKISNLNNDIYYYIYINNNFRLFNNKYFLTIEEYRDNKLEELGI